MREVRSKIGWMQKARRMAVFGLRRYARLSSQARSIEHGIARNDKLKRGIDGIRIVERMKIIEKEDKRESRIGVKIKNIF